MERISEEIIFDLNFISDDKEDSNKIKNLIIEDDTLKEDVEKFETKEDLGIGEVLGIYLGKKLVDKILNKAPDVVSSLSDFVKKLFKKKTDNVQLKGTISLGKITLTF
ncbi:MAG: hypothetical protein HeimC3_39350 [Candidatus Heimdallarchaeota archaeon LC_3]|nr:MAG: hypothetical protein HeimC3_39350 [Candidatus Heimdallarchaeota archaeon LC_3]